MTDDDKMRIDCAWAMDYRPHMSIWSIYNPLENAAHAMALVVRFKLHIDQRVNADGTLKQVCVQPHDFTEIVYGEMEQPQPLYRAICKCVQLIWAKAQVGG